MPEPSPRLSDEPRWWTIRRSQNSKPSTYTCPLCGGYLHAMSPHILIAPEGNTAGRRHAHTECVEAARKAGTLPSYDEWRAAEPKRPGLLGRLFGRS